MNYALQFVPEVVADVRGGQAWYEDKGVGSGAEFAEMFYAAARDLIRYPLQCPEVHEGFRRRLLGHFLFGIYYRVENETVVVFGLFHYASDPLQLHDELANRGSQS